MAFTADLFLGASHASASRSVIAFNGVWRRGNKKRGSFGAFVRSLPSLGRSESDGEASAEEVVLCRSQSARVHAVWSNATINKLLLNIL